MESADLIIIGAGPGGYECAAKAAQAGLKVIIIEKKEVGGTCLNEGCIPTKCLCRSAEVMEVARQAKTFGILTGEVKADWAQIIARKDTVVSQLVSGIHMLLKSPQIHLVQGEARFVDAHTLAVGDALYTAPKIIIATGSVTKFLPIEGAHAAGVLTSTDLLQAASQPASLCVIGGGVIGLEFASIFQTLGTQVSVVEYCKEILPNFDSELAKRLRMSLKKKGIVFKTGAAVRSIVSTPDGLTVGYEEKGKTDSLSAERVLMAVGRAANVGALNLDDVGIAYTPRGINVDEHMQTNVPGIYAVGDVNGLCQLAHAATFQSYKVLNHILGKTDGIRLDIVPAAVFTTPELASVGLTEEQCKANGLSCKVHKAFYRANGKALAMGEDEGLVKAITDENGLLLGMHIMGAHAADLIHEAAAFMQTGASLRQMQEMIHAHPTLSELLASL